jgi:TetR/AcrR family transcriptional repressor of nem operon
MPRSKQFDPDEALAQAETLFAERGYAAVSISDLVERLGLNRSSLYATWGDKHGLYLATLDRYRRKAGGRLLADLATASSGLAGIRRHLERVVEEACSERPVDCLMTHATMELGPVDDDTAERAEGSREGMIEAFAQAIRRAQDEGDVDREAHAQQLGRLLAVTVYGLRTLARTRPPRAVLIDAVEGAMRAVEVQ